MRIQDIVTACDGTLLNAGQSECPEIYGGQVDSRKIEAGNLFFAMPGERVDGHDYVNKAFALGAVAAVVEHPIADATGPCILVEDSQKALAKIAAYYRSTLEIPIVGITGSVGKTSTKEMIASILSERFCVQKTAGNFNNEIGMPLTLLSIRPEHEVAVVEMGINHFGEMARMSEVARPDLFVMTNIGACHLEFLGDLPGVLKAKTEGLPMMKQGAALILNGEDAQLRTLAGNTYVRPLYFGIHAVGHETGDAALYAYADAVRAHGADGASFVFHVEGKDVPATLHVPGDHMILNALAGVCVAKELGLREEEIAAGIAHMQTISGRSNFISHDGKTIIDDCYNANPVSMKASLNVLSQCEGRRIAVLGDMGELGSTEKELHREVGEYAATLGLDALFVTGTLCRSLADGYTANGGKNLQQFVDKDALIEGLRGYVQTGDTVLVKASHFMGYDAVVEALNA